MPKQTRTRKWAITKIVEADTIDEAQRKKGKIVSIKQIVPEKEQSHDAIGFDADFNSYYDE